MHNNPQCPVPQMSYLLGHVSASIDYICELAARNKSYELFEKLADIQQHLNVEIAKIFGDL